MCKILTVVIVCFEFVNVNSAFLGRNSLGIACLDVCMYVSMYACTYVCM